MNKKYIIRKNEEIQNLIKQAKKLISKYFIVYYINNDYKYNRYCISVSKKIGKANVRNLFKRRIKDVLIKNNINNSKDYVIILRTAVLNASYNQINDELIRVLEGEK